jgi:hypothetical protein
LQKLFLDFRGINSFARGTLPAEKENVLEIKPRSRGDVHKIDKKVHFVIKNGVGCEIFKKKYFLY